MRTNRSYFNRVIVAGIGCLLALALVAPAAAADQGGKRAPRPADKLKYLPLNPIVEPQVLRETLPNGLRLLLVEDRALPKIQLRAMIRGGRVAEPKDGAGLTELFGETLRTGGVASMSGDAVDEFLDRRGASIEGGVDTDAANLSAEMLVEHRDEVLPLFVEFLQRPAFAQEKVDLAKKHLRSAIARRNDDVEGIADREFNKLIFGATSPDARQYEYADIDRLTRGDLLGYHKRVFRPDQTLIAAWGDFKAADMKQKLADLLGKWTAEGPAPSYKPPVAPTPSFSVNYVEKKDVEQTYFVLGHIGLRFDDPDYPAVLMMGQILGGGFASRLFVQVRTEKGLAYRAGGRMVPRYDRPGAFIFYTSTKPSTTSVALQTVLDEVRKIREAPVSEDELQRAKDGYLNSFAFDFASNARIVNRLLTYEFYGYPPDFNTRLRTAVDKVTQDDVLRVAKKHLQPDAVTILAVGKADEFDKPLSTFGKVNTIDITIPEPKLAEELPAATPETLARGRELLVAAARARGEQALRGLKDLTVEGAIGQETPMGMMDMKLKMVLAPPDRQWAELASPMGSIVMVTDGPAAWMKMGPQSRALPGSQASEMRRGISTGYGCLGLLQQALAGKVEGQALGRKDFEGQSSEAVLVRFEDRPVTVYLAPDGSAVLGTSSWQQTEEGLAEFTTVYSDWRAFDGLLLPQSTLTKSGGKTKATAKVDSAKINAGYDAAIFEKPTS